MSKHSEACCSIPPVTAQGYEPKGKYIEVDGLKTYVTGPSTASSALLVIYDIFGFFPQTLQGADILAHADSSHQYQVFMPDFFEGQPAHISWYPPDTDDKKEKMGAFFQGPAAPPKTAERVPKIVKTLGEMNPGLQKWGAIVSLTTREGTPFSVAAECHPAMVDPEDAKHVSIPLAVLASKDEDAEAIKQFEKNLTVPKHVETFGDQLHGWMAARADLQDSKVRAEYERGYKSILTFFHEYL
ncbi:MAG: hypothetical protein M1817_001189 [Caeruleum heppii]|nr:MAG: hypothetical protein M1817_001189 [Caeruleum heppii]